jgi:hypothetical protein
MVISSPFCLNLAGAFFPKAAGKGDAFPTAGFSQAEKEKGNGGPAKINRYRRVSVNTFLALYRCLFRRQKT